MPHTQAVFTLTLLTGGNTMRHQAMRLIHTVEEFGAFLDKDAAELFDDTCAIQCKLGRNEADIIIRNFDEHNGLLIFD